MPKTETPSYQASRQRHWAAPIYVGRPFYVKTYSDGADFPFSRDFATGPVNGGGDVLQTMGPPTGNTQTVQTELGQSSIGTFTVPILDDGGEVTRYLGNPAIPLLIDLGYADDVIYAQGPLDGYPTKGTLILEAERIRYAAIDLAAGRFIGCRRGVDGTSAMPHMAGIPLGNGEQLRAGQRMQLYAGYADVPFVNFMAIAKMEIASIALAQDGLTFLFALADIQRSMRKAVFTTWSSDNQLNMAENPITIALRMLLSSGTAVDIGGTCRIFANNLVVGTSDFTIFNIGDYVLIGLGTDSEQLARVGQIVDATTFLSSLPLTPTPPPPAAGQLFRKAGQNGKYDVLRASDAVGIPPAMVDVAGLEALRDSQFPNDRFHFRLNVAESDGKAFIESQIWQPNNLYPFITQDGKYSAKRYAPPPASTPLALGEDDIATWSWQGGERAILNEVDFLYDWNTAAAPNDYGTRQRYTTVATQGSINAFGLRPPLKITARGIRTSVGAQAMLDNRAAQLLQRFSVPPPILAVTVRYSNHVLDIGDFVAVTHRFVPNRKTGKRGLVNEIFEVRDVTPLYGATGKVGMTLLHVGAQDTIPTPTGLGPINALLDLLIFRAAFFNAASIALETNIEDQTGAVTVTTQRSGDTLHIQARQYVTSPSVATTPADVISRIRVGSVGGTLVDGIMPEPFLTGTASAKTTDQYARRGIVKHEVLYTPPTIGPITIIMSALCPIAGGSARDRSMTVTVRSH